MNLLDTYPPSNSLLTAVLLQLTSIEFNFSRICTCKENLITNVHDDRDKDRDKEGLGGCFYDSEGKHIHPPLELSLFPPKCYRCDFSNYNTKGVYEFHCVTRHPGKPAYPGPADIKEGLIPQGMSWERGKFPF